ncbi:hypothetical protein LZ31DRAFT_548093 [Colletotrichum somersetense]|nr:hypothetical protein LZ31DRAFT_548093 [Colletotrichum somersetense]
MPDSLSWTLCALSSPLRGLPSLTSRTTWLRPSPLQYLGLKLVDVGMTVLHAKINHSQPSLHSTPSGVVGINKSTDKNC